MRLARLESDKAYIGNDLYLPKSAFGRAPLQRMLTFPDFQGEDRVLLVEHKHHLEVPRNSVRAEIIEQMKVELVDLRPQRFAPVDMKPKAGFTLLQHQIPAWAAMVAWDEDLTLRLDTGRGKTIMGWRLSCETPGPTLVVSAQAAHLENWTIELREWFDYRGKVGWIDKDKMDWKCGVVLCTIQTLAKRAQAGALPPGFARRFGLIIFDEVHHQAAKWFCVGSNVTSGRRLGLTATLKRRDRCEGIVTAHIGPVVYDDPAEDALIPEVWVWETGIDLTDDPEILDCLGQPNVSRLRSRLGEMSRRNTQIVGQIRKRLKEGHKVYLLSHIREHLDLLVRMLREHGVGVGHIQREQGAEERLRQLNLAEVTATTVHLGKEAYNRKALSALVMASPIGADNHAATEWIQAAGRILRPMTGKKDPVIDLFMDSNTNQSRGLTYSVLAWCRQHKWPEKGDRWRRTRTTWKT